MVNRHDIVQATGVTERQLTLWVTDGLLFPPSKGRNSQWPPDTVNRVTLIQEALTVQRSITYAAQELLLNGYVLPGRCCRQLLCTLVPASPSSQGASESEHVPIVGGLNRTQRRRIERYWKHRERVIGAYHVRDLRKVFGPALRALFAGSRWSERKRQWADKEGPFDDLVEWVGLHFGLVHTALDRLSDENLERIQIAVQGHLNQEQEHWRRWFYQKSDITPRQFTKKILQVINHTCPRVHGELDGLRWMLLVWGVVMTRDDAAHGMELATYVVKADEQNRIGKAMKGLFAVPLDEST